jgi:hypothetical protein
MGDALLAHRNFKMNHVEPYAYLHDVLRRMVDGYSVNRLDELLPWHWKAARGCQELGYVQTINAYP